MEEVSLTLVAVARFPVPATGKRATASKVVPGLWAL